MNPQVAVTQYPNDRPEPVRFTANLNHGKPKPKRIKAGAEARYTDALGYLLMLLEKGDWEQINPVKYASEWRISSGFMNAIEALGGLDRRQEGKTSYYRAKPVLSSIKPRQILNHKRDQQRRYREERGQQAVFNTVVLPEPIDLIPPLPVNAMSLSVGPLAESADIILVGVLQDGKLIVDMNMPRFEGYAAALNAADQMEYAPGQKVALLRVLDVLEPVRELRRASL